MQARRAYVRMLPFSDAVAEDYVAAKHMDITALSDADRCASQYILSPLQAGVLVKPGSATRVAIEFLTGWYSEKPTGTLHPGYVAELLFAEGMTRSFCRLISESTLAREHINALERVHSSSKLVFDAQQLMRVTLAKNVATDVLRELGL